MNDYISKPVDAKLLLAKLESIRPKGNLVAPGMVISNLVEAPVVDFGQLDALRDALPMARFKGFLRDYFTEVELRLVAMVEKRARGDIKGIASEAHTLVSVCGNVGAMQASLLAGRLEEACRRGDRDNLYDRISDLNEACTSSSDAIRAWVSKAVDAEPPAPASAA